MTLPRIVIAAVACAFALAATACVEPRTELLSDEDIYVLEPWTTVAEQPVSYEARSPARSYGLPEAGQASIADLIAVIEANRDDSSYFFAEDRFASGDVPLADCRFDAAVATDQFPMRITGVVTHHPRRFVKVEVCDREEDERFWGTFVIEDDTGGIVVLRPGRSANFTFGDRITLDVYGAMLTFGLDADTRAILSYDIVDHTGVADDEAFDRTMLYEAIDRPFDASDSSEVRRIEGYTYQSPTNANFNEMLVADRPVAANYALDEPLIGPLLQCVRVCEGLCTSRCGVPALCSDACEARCDADRSSPTVDDTPTCWNVSIDIDLGRRGFSPPTGDRVQVTGPIVNNFDRQLWIYSPDQIVTLESDDAG